MNPYNSPGVAAAGFTSRLNAGAGQLHTDSDRRQRCLRGPAWRPVDALQNEVGRNLRFDLSPDNLSQKQAKTCGCPLTGPDEMRVMNYLYLSMCSRLMMRCVELVCGSGMAVKIVLILRGEIILHYPAAIRCGRINIIDTRHELPFVLCTTVGVACVNQLMAF